MGLKDFAKNVGGAMNKGAMQAPVLHAAQFARSRFKFSNTGDLSMRPAPLLRPQVSINTEITVHKTNIASEKKKFGADVYPLLEASGGVWTEECTKLWTESLAKVLQC